MITVILNGRPVPTQEHINLLEFLESMKEPHGAALVELNHRLVRKESIPEICLKHGDVVEVILPAFGG